MPRCKNCKDKFEPKYFNQKFCMIKDECIKEHLEYSKQQQKKQWNKRKKELKEDLKTHKDYLKELQIVFNKFIRLRDKDKPCISCGKVNGSEQAGHYKSVGSSPNLRFNEDNVHGQCIRCNMHLHGNLIEYRKGLINRFGIDYVVNIETDKKVRKYTINELKELKKYYLEKIKTF